jgi:2-C-methyl-D-erythritol 4-phosphate cytidylyltransferase/2-C-methyl-D-erythritol 2,4-cyclodiphosphate synthase
MMMKTTAQPIKVHAVIPAAGRGVRFGSSSNKILQTLHGRAIVEWSVDALRSVADQVTVVAGSGDFDQLQKIVAHDNVRIIVGGQTRQESVWKGLQMEDSDDTIVVVHDAARPLATTDLIQRCIASAETYGSGVSAVPVVDALKSSHQLADEFFISHDIDRGGVWAAQTPQAFRLGLLREAHIKAITENFHGLDESSLVQRLPDTKVHLVHGERENIKITTEDDLLLAERLCNTPTDTRTGIGYDIHRLVTGRPLWLGGVLIPSSLGLDGHSDADVIIHAICDSLLGAAALGDIGKLFPNDDPQYSGISSLLLLESVRDHLKTYNWGVVNIDAMVIAEQPKISPYVDKMRHALSESLRVSPDRVSVKATTNEGIGSLGASAGIACHATACIFRSR